MSKPILRIDKSLTNWWVNNKKLLHDNLTKASLQCKNESINEVLKEMLHLVDNMEVKSK